MYSHVAIHCANEKQVKTVCQFKWPETIGTHVTICDNDIIIKNYFTDDNAKTILTDVAIVLAQQHPDISFSIHALIDNDKTYYRSRLLLMYNNHSLSATYSTNNYIFANQHICLDCGDDITGAPKLPEFHCPSCGVSYAMTGSDNAKDADYLFGLDEGTYIIPIPAIE